jgi:hypothetical protein
VLRWDTGTFAWEADREGAVDVRLDGARVTGPVALRNLADGRWTWEWH